MGLENGRQKCNYYAEVCVSLDMGGCCLEMAFPPSTRDFVQLHSTPYRGKNSVWSFGKVFAECLAIRSLNILLDACHGGITIFCCFCMKKYFI